MFVASVWMRAKEGMRDRVLELAQGLVENTRQEEGCIEHTFYPSTEDDQGIFVFEVWESKEISVPHTKADYYIAYRKAREGMIEEDSYRMVLYEAEETYL